MKSVRPDNSDPIPLQKPPLNMTGIILRFVALLLAATLVLVLIWSR